MNRTALLTRFDATPTENQMKLLISQVLSRSFAYNSPVIVLDFEVAEDGEYSYMGKSETREASIPIDSVTHIIKNGQRYKLQ